MLQALYRLFIKPRSSHPDHAEREIVLSVLLVGMLGLCLAALLNTLVLGLLLFSYDYLFLRIVAVLSATLTFGGLYYLARYKGLHSLAATTLITMGLVAATFMVYQWGLLLPTAVILFSLIIVMAGILQGARYSVYVAGLVILVLSALQYAKTVGWVNPDLEWMKSSSTVGDIIGFSALYLVIALVSWLFNRQMALSLNRAYRAESALLLQNERLEEKVRKRTRELEKEQLEKVQHMYRFAELGHVSTALFHDLANHVSTISIDIENLQRGSHSDLLERIDENIHYIDDIVRRVRQQLQGKKRLEKIDVEREIKEVARVASFSDTNKINIELVFNGNEDDRALYGDVVRFRQMIMNLLSNAIEAYKTSRASPQQRQVKLETMSGNNEIVINISDRGTGIATAQQEKIFDPFYSSKEGGAGIGLFIVKQVVEKDFKGQISFVSSKKTGTVFTVKLPLGRSHYAA